MKQYYIFINEEQLGPFNIEELKNKKISRETKVWFEGLENWKNATEIEELKPIFSSIPPASASVPLVYPKQNILLNLLKNQNSGHQPKNDIC